MKHRRALLAASVTGALMLGGVVTAGIPAAAAATGCSVSYTVQSQWPGGFTAAVAVTNLGDPLSNWTLTFDFPEPDQQVSHGWGATWTQTGTRASAASMSWNAALGTGAMTSIGFNGSWSGTNPVPRSFALNGTTCNGPVTTPTATPPPTTPPPTTPPPTTPPPTTPPPTTPPPTGPAPELHVSGNRILTADGDAYRLLGVSRSGAEFACVQGKGLWDSGPVDQASVNAMKTWNIHAVRLPLNEECWLGLNGSPGGAAYQQGVKDYVNLLVANGINVILDLHWTWGGYPDSPEWHCKDEHATCQKPMPDARYAPQFWTGVANTFKGNDAVVFDLFNEPYPDMPAEWNKTLGWQCLRDGGTCAGLPYEVAGMQDLVDAVRATGATNLLMIGGLEWANDMREWLTYRPDDPLDNLAASWHAYSFNACASESCWDSQIAPLAQQVPVVIGEFGQDDCGFDYMRRLVAWADTHDLGYLAWTWSPWGCTGGAVLIKDWAGTPEPGVGEGYKAHLLTQDPYL
ncbi:cellulase family glycosylhydrolase [Micromonospora sp. WMMD987]|uniref:cellulase family glycosylhydrolase n=1 Tax=Micromonospora sp. WMMD987 TaxID=3016089 RepID=UPI002499D9DB|nr:cellulase family glycosylhydrolase [Micromonospora sp. WMMD987]WFE97573.1 cellulase family glycosylhydrolase [Micromonospora sp. WMMD987]